MTPSSRHWEVRDFVRGVGDDTTRAWDLVLGAVTDIVGAAEAEESMFFVDFVRPADVFRYSGEALVMTFAFLTTFSFSSRKRRDNWSR
jgi:hypothetical protein